DSDLGFLPPAASRQARAFLLREGERDARRSRSAVARALSRTPTAKVRNPRGRVRGETQFGRCAAERARYLPECSEAASSPISANSCSVPPAIPASVTYFPLTTIVGTLRTR